MTGLQSKQGGAGSAGATGAAPQAAPGTVQGTGVFKGDAVLSTLNDDGSRRWLKPRLSQGSWWRRRRALAYFLIAIFTLIPYIQINGMPAVLLNVPARRFTIFGYTFLPTDTLLLEFFVMSVFVAVFLLTALMGRVWCGWACPQTVYMEFVYRPIERLFEGPPGRKAKGRFRGTPAAKALKYAAYFVVSCYLAHTFLAYFVGVEALREWVTRSPFEHPSSFIIMALTTGLMMFDFSYFREQTCLVACPYGRFQSVLLDRQSLIVNYDARRGEPRGKAVRHTGKTDLSLPVVKAGDCVDCGLCVQTCPTGIDIRNGLQMECVHCTQCMDACDAVMTKVGRPTGLIRYGSQAGMSGERVRLLRPRVVLYPTILVVLLTALTALIATKAPADVTVIRGRGAAFIDMGGGTIGNQVKVKIANRQDVPATFMISAQGPAGVALRAEENPVTVPPGEFRTVPALLTVPWESLSQGKATVSVIVTSSGEFSSTRIYTLTGPVTRPAAIDRGPQETPR